MVGVRRRFDDATSRGWTLLAASAFGLGGLLAGGVLTTLLLGRSNPGPLQADLLVLTVGAGIGAFALGALFWWRLVEVPRTPSALRGGAAGVLTGLFANFVAWFVHFLWSLATSGMDGSAVEVLGTMASYVLVVGGTSLVVTAVVVGPVGGVIGVGLARTRRRRPDTPAVGTAPDRVE